MLTPGDASFRGAVVASAVGWGVELSSGSVVVVDEAKLRTTNNIINTATTVGGLNVDTRTSRVKWVPQENNWAWLYEKLADYAQQANDHLWNFNLHTLPEQIQYTEYLGSKNGKYEWHQDIGPGMLSWRKVSITVQLSEPDEYEGGDLQIFQGGEYKDQNFINAPRKAGCVFIFPSYMLHRVTPVTKGIRKSFVLWSGGGHYK